MLQIVSLLKILQTVFFEKWFGKSYQFKMGMSFDLLLLFYGSIL